MGQLPAGAVTLVETVGRRRGLRAAATPTSSPIVTQTTLSVDDTAEIVALLKARFPDIVGPHKEDICYATTNRQEAVKRVAPAGRCDDRRRRAELVELAAPARGRRARRLPASRVLVQRAAEHRLDDVRGHPQPRHHRRRLGAGGAGRGDHRRLRRALRRQRRDRLRPRTRTCSSRCRASCGPTARAERLHGGLYRGLRRGAGAPSSPATTSASCCPTRASPRASRTPTSCCTPRTGSFILTLYEKRVASGDLPFFLGLMEHLAARGLTCPQPVQEPRRRGARRRWRAGRPRSSPFSTACGRAGRTPRIAPRSARRWRGCIWPARDFPMTRPNALSVDGLAAAVRAGRERAPTRVQPGLRERIADELDHLEAHWPRDLPRRRHPRRPVSRQRVLPRRQAVGPDRLLFRLQRRPRLRPRDLPQRLVLRAGSLLQRHQGAGAARRL